MKIIAFGAHPDDLEVGMGGTIAAYRQRGHDVLMVVATVPNRQEERKKEAAAAATVLGAELRLLDIDPEHVTFDREMVRRCDDIIKAANPDVVFTHWNHDSHQDHIAVANAVIAATRKNNCSVYLYEQTIPGGVVPYSFRAQTFIDITDTIETKEKSIEAHASQVGSNGDWWLYGVKGRAMYRGYQINVKYAEAFEVVKEIKTI